jgi:magnesium-transporting ATPase (P-type)
MATGDNTLTAISVGRDCNILNLYQDVYFPEVQQNQIIWKNENTNQICQDPFLLDLDNFGVALNG